MKTSEYQQKLELISKALVEAICEITNNLLASDHFSVAYFTKHLKASHKERAGNENKRCYFASPITYVRHTNIFHTLVFAKLL